MTSPVRRALEPAARAGDLLLSGFERTMDAGLDAVLNSPRTERVVDRVLAQPGLERLVERVLRSDLAVRTVDRVLESEEMERIVSHVAQSPEVREAIASQTVGLAGEVGSEVRTRAVAGDDVAERLVRRLLGRRRGAAAAERDAAPADHP